MERQQTLVIKTPEGITFPLIIASPIARFLALAIDKVCISLVSFVLGAGMRVAGLISPDLAAALVMLTSFVVSLGYGILLEWYWRGQTLGKRLMRIRVMDEQGLRMRFSQVVVRNILRFVDMLPAFYLVGGISCLVTSRGQRLGDIAANTIVIHNPVAPEPDLDQALPGKFNSFRDHPHLAARLRQNVSPAAASVALRALLRRAELDDESRLTLFHEIRVHMAGIVAFPEEVTDGVSDEQYVRNVVDILFR